MHYFSFILFFGLTLLVIPHIRAEQTSTHWAFYSIVFSQILASIWTAICRWSVNIRLALSAHSLVLSFWITSMLFHIYLLLFNWFMINELYLNIYFALSTIGFHILFSLTLDLFWVFRNSNIILSNCLILQLSALSTSIVTVYLSILPIDLLFNGTMLHMLLNIWLYNRYFLYPIVNLVTITGKGFFFSETFKILKIYFPLQMLLYLLYSLFL